MKTVQKVSISIEGGGISFKREIDERVAAQVMALCLGVEEADISAATDKASGGLLSTSSRSRKESAAEYVNRFAAKRNPDKILTLAGYLKEVHGRDSFHAGEIKGLFRDAGEILPANFNRDFRWVQNSGWITPDAHSKGTFYITNTGLKVLKDGFPKEMVQRSKFKTDGRRKRNKSKEKNTL